LAESFFDDFTIVNNKLSQEEFNFGIQK